MAQVSAVDHYRRLSAALTGLAEVSTGPDGVVVARLLAGDEVVLARMQAAAAVVREAGLPVRIDGSGQDLLHGAVGWERYAEGPVTPLHADCGRDLCRGLLRLWSRRAAPPGRGDQRARLRAARVRLASQLRAQCAGLRAELSADPAGPEDRVAGVVARLCEALSAELADAGARGTTLSPPPIPDLPPLRRVVLEDRLSLVFGAGFGLGAALTLGRLASALWPGPPAAVLGAAVGVALGGWVVRARRQLAERVARERWAAEVSSAVRAGLAEYISAELLAADSQRFRD